MESYFNDIFKPVAREPGTMETIINEAITPIISAETNNKLTSLPDEAEIKAALFSIHPGKAPGPDGFSACFFQSNWGLMGKDIVSEIREFFLSGQMPRTINETHLRLIPKILSPMKVADYRPIALCNVSYKIISKLLAKRLQPLLGDLITETQSAFVPKRAISDNVLITHEFLHYLKTSKAAKHCYMAVKTDMSKAYDRLEWDFIKLAILRFGVHPIFTEWIMQCISTVSYSFIINDASRGLVLPGRGIRQGDPLSPYIFILCSELLSSLCNLRQRNGKFKGIKIAAEAPCINHLLFADDTMFFCKANAQNAQTLKQILATYEAISGQLINTQKSAISFSKHTGQDIKSTIKQILNIENVGGFGKYLGLPEQLGRRKKESFSGIVTRIKHRAISWSSKFLTRAGKLIMLRSVLSAMPSHAMSCYKLPQGLCDQIQTLMTRFWWDPTQEKRSMAWISWKKMARPKKFGGLGLKDIPTFNDALLAKISWRIIKNPSCLLARVLLGKYCKGKSFLSIQPTNASSHGWKSVLVGRNLLTPHLGWIVGTGKEINVWNDPWLSSTEQLRPIGPVPEHLQDLKVSDLMLENSTEWDVQKIERYLPFHSTLILQIKPSLCESNDVLIWLKSVSGEYSTKSGYRLAVEALIHDDHDDPMTSRDWLANVWHLKTAEKIKIFIWNSLHDALPVGEQFMIRNIPLPNRCARCTETESVFHVLFSCRYAKSVWKLASLSVNFDPSNVTSTWEGVNHLRLSHSLPPTGLGPGSLPSWIYWNLWITRNQLIFQKRDFSAEETVLKAIREAREWTTAQSTEPSPHLPPSRINQDPPPNTNRPCMYTDAAWNHSTKRAGLAWIIDDTGSSTSLSATSSSVGSPLIAETLALRNAMISALRLGHNDLLILSDSQVLINLVKTKGTHIEIVILLADIQFLSTQFIAVDFKFIPRRFNSRADLVAKQALLLSNPV